MDISGRLDLYRESLGLTISQMADQAGIPRPTLWQFLNGRNKTLRDDMTNKLHLAFPNLNVLWLLFGEGEMETGSNIEISEPKNADVAADLPGQAAVNKENINTIPGDLFAQIPYINNKSQESNDNKQQSTRTETPQKPPIAIEPQIQTGLSPTVSIQPDASKRIQTIMVFYNDNSFEIFRPSNQKE